MVWRPAVPDSLRSLWTTLARRIVDRAVRGSGLVMVDLGRDEPGGSWVERMEDRIAEARSEGR